MSLYGFTEKNSEGRALGAAYPYVAFESSSLLSGPADNMSERIATKFEELTEEFIVAANRERESLRTLIGSGAKMTEADKTYWLTYFNLN